MIDAGEDDLSRDEEEAKTMGYDNASAVNTTYISGGVKK